MNKIGSKSCNFTTEIQDYDANMKSKGTLSAIFVSQIQLSQLEISNAKEPWNMRPKVATFGNFFVHSALVRCHLESTWFWNWYTVLNIKWCSDQYLTRILFPIWVIIKEMSCKLREMSMSNCQPDRTNRPSLAAASPTSPIHGGRQVFHNPCTSLHCCYFLF